MSQRSLWNDIRHDYLRYKISNNAGFFRVVFFTQGFWAVFTYRLNNAVYRNVRVPGLRQLLLAWFSFNRKLIEVTTGILLPGTCEIGPGLYIGHFGPVILNSEVSMGANCNLSQGVTLGGKDTGQYKGVPRIGDRVYIGPNAVVIGRIDIGDDAAIGAGAVVTKPVPARAVAAGNPARVISYRGSFESVNYAGMQQDEARQASLALAERDSQPPEE